MLCYINIVTDTTFIRDPEGAEFADLASAQEEAAQSARDLMADQLRQGQPAPLHWKALVMSDHETVLLTIPFHTLAHGCDLPPTAERRSQRFMQLRQRVREQEHLVEADRHVLEGQERIEAQRARVVHMERTGNPKDVALARNLLQSFEAALELSLYHRRMILEELSGRATKGRDRQRADVAT
jgi:hypothetical protein